jgi:hypothetical protein
MHEMSIEQMKRDAEELARLKAEEQLQKSTSAQGVPITIPQYDNTP